MDLFDTRGVVDFGWNSEALIEMMAQQAKLAAVGIVGIHEGDKGASSDNAGSAGLAAMQSMAARCPASQAVACSTSADLKPMQEASAVVSKNPATEDDVDSRLEAMVEDLAGVESFTLVEDSASKAETPSGAPTKASVDSAMRHSDLRLSAPTFVPGQMWTGQQRSSFVD